MTTTNYSVRPISVAEHDAFIEANAQRTDISFMQHPAWAQVKEGWRSLNLGFFDGDELVGVGLALLRAIPKTKRYFAYLPEGPVLPWGEAHVPALLDCLVNYLKRHEQCFAVRIGPYRTIKSWTAKTVKTALASHDYQALSDVPADHTDIATVRLSHELYQRGWRKVNTDANSFGKSQPQFNYVLDVADKSDDELLAGMNQLWRRNIKRARKNEVEVRRGTRDDIETYFYPVYCETAQRDQFSPRSLAYIQQQWDAFNAGGRDRFRLYLAIYQGNCVAAMTLLHNAGQTWYMHGASTMAHRDVRGSNALQWQMITDTRDLGASRYNLRGFTEGLTDDNRVIGLVQFKSGTGGEAVMFPGEWTFPINKALTKIFELALAVRPRLGKMVHRVKKAPNAAKTLLKRTRSRAA